MEECSVSATEKHQCYRQLSTKLDGQLISPGLDVYTKQQSQVLPSCCCQTLQAALLPTACRPHPVPCTVQYVCTSAVPENPMCRICHDSGAQEELLSPCECCGTLATIHRSCLEHWLSASGTSFCELCHYQFTVQRKSRSLLEWMQNPSLRQEKRTLFGDMVCFLLITPLATISGWLCLRGAIDHLHFASRLEAVGLISLTVALFTIYLFWTLGLRGLLGPNPVHSMGEGQGTPWMSRLLSTGPLLMAVAATQGANCTSGATLGVSLRYHCRLYNEWRQSSQRVVLLLPRSHSETSVLHSLHGGQRWKQPSKESIV